MAYARLTEKDAVVVVINNDTKPATVSFEIADVKPIAAAAALTDRLGNATGIGVSGGVIKLTLPPRKAAILTR